jgi:hypothetical protein
MPATELTRQTRFSLYDPRYSAPLIDGFGTRTYWTCNWMDMPSYEKWLAAQAAKTPGGQLKQVNPDRYRMQFSVSGQHFVWTGDAGIKRVKGPKPAHRRR